MDFKLGIKKNWFVNNMGFHIAELCIINYMLLLCLNK